MFIELFKVPIYRCNCLNYLQLSDRDVGVVLELCLVPRQGQEVLVILDEGLLHAQPVLALLPSPRPAAPPANHYQHQIVFSNIILPQLRNNLSKFPSCEQQNETDD